MKEFRIEVRPLPDTSDHEVLFFADDTELIEMFSRGMIGLDPNDMLIEPCTLRAGNSAHMAIIACCECGCVGCDSIKVRIQREADRVRWTEVKANTIVEFEADQYAGEIERAINDYSWETPERTASRFIAQTIDASLLKSRGFTFGWASGRCRARMMSVSLMLEPGPYQVLIHLPWDGQDIEEIVHRMKAVLAQHPNSWPSVEWNPQAPDLAPPPFRGPGWDGNAII